MSQAVLILKHLNPAIFEQFHAPIEWLGLPDFLKIDGKSPAIWGNISDGFLGGPTILATTGHLVLKKHLC